MKAQIYRCTGAITRSILYATRIAEVELHDPDEDPRSLAATYGGDFATIEDDDNELNDEPN